MEGRLHVQSSNKREFAGFRAPKFYPEYGEYFSRVTITATIEYRDNKTDEVSGYLELISILINLTGAQDYLEIEEGNKSELEGLRSRYPAYRSVKVNPKHKIIRFKAEKDNSMDNLLPPAYIRYIKILRRYITKIQSIKTEQIR